MNGSGIQNRILFATSMLMLVLTFLAGRLIWLQIYQHDRFSEVVRQEHRRKLILPARRGSIYDRNSELLVADRSVRDVVADRLHLSQLGFAARALAHAETEAVRERLGPNAEEVTPRDIQEAYSAEGMRKKYLELVAHRIARPLGKRPWEVLEKLTTGTKNDIFLAPRFDESQAIELERILEEEKIRGIYCRRAMDRFYTYDRRLTHVLGWVNRDNEGVEGGEKSFDQNLAGADGFREIEYVRGGVEMPSHRGESRAPVDGDSVYLTIDMRIQEVIEKRLEEAKEDYHYERAMVVVTRPRTGEILGMASRPHFDRSTGKKGSRSNLCISSAYPPGSTFKIITFSGVYENRLVSPLTPVNCLNGVVEVPGLGRMKDHHPYASLSASKVLAKSSNIGTYQLARQLGREKLIRYVRDFGFGSKTGVLLSGESRGIVHPDEKWTTASMWGATIGYEVSVTPLQMAMALGAVANGGELLAPQLALRISDHQDQPVGAMEPRTVRRVIGERAAGWVRASMAEAVLEGGTGTSAVIDGVTVAGKTGTARKWFSAIEAFGDKRYVSSFAGFFPVENPEIAIVVVLDDPLQKQDNPTAKPIGLMASGSAAPVFGKIGSDIADILRLRSAVTTASKEGGVR